MSSNSIHTAAQMFGVDLDSSKISRKQTKMFYMTIND